MRISHKKLVHDLEVLRHGGDEAVELFLEMGRKFLHEGGIDYLESWIGVASPALPEATRHVVMSALLRALFSERTVHVELEQKRPTLQ